jgi:hypothetical protein
MIPKRVTDRLVRSVAKFQQILAAAKVRDINESDTVLSSRKYWLRYLVMTSSLSLPANLPSEEPIVI